MPYKFKIVRISRSSKVEHLPDFITSGKKVWKYLLLIKKLQDLLRQKVNRFVSSDNIHCKKRIRNVHSHTEEMFLGGLSLHLNHLIASRTANYDWPFGTHPFWTFWLKFGHKGP